MTNKLLVVHTNLYILKAACLGQTLFMSRIGQRSFVTANHNITFGTNTKNIDVLTFIMER